MFRVVPSNVKDELINNDVLSTLNDHLSPYTRRFIIVEAAKNITVLDEKKLIILYALIFLMRKKLTI